MVGAVAEFSKALQLKENTNKMKIQLVYAKA